MTPGQIRSTYLTLTLLETAALSLIWGVNTLFLLDAGLSITEAFIVNGAFSAGYLLFEVPTGVIADSAGRRASYLLGAVTLLVATVGYYVLWSVEAGLAAWVVVSLGIGLGFTFFSGATEAWVVDALHATGFDGEIEDVFGARQAAYGFAFLIGILLGGLLAQINLGVPYLVRSVVLLALIVFVVMRMRDIGFEPDRSQTVGEGVKRILRNSVEHGFRNRPMRLLILGAPFTVGVFFWVFYGFQPYVLELADDQGAVYLAAVAAAVFALAQMVGGWSVSRVRRLFRLRTTILAVALGTGVVAMIGIGLAQQMPRPLGLWVAVALFGTVAFADGVFNPVRQAYISEIVPSEQRATVLSFDAMMGDGGGVIAQPALGRVADVYSLGVGYVVAGIVYSIRIPLVIAVRRMGLGADRANSAEDAVAD
ncbi:MAG: MFS transporter [Acidimicrobiia bacterium]|nr:MFS transporter [Acidimicrobiia bacterium]